MIHVSVCGQLQLGAYDDEDVPINVYTHAHFACLIHIVSVSCRHHKVLTTAFTCHCPIRIRHNLGSAYIGNISGTSNQNNSQQKQIGQSTKEEEKSEPSIATRPANSNNCRWRFSTRQQTFGPVDVHINIRGRGGCRCTVPYKVVLAEGGYECVTDTLPLFIEKRPHQQLKPIKMVDITFSLEMQFSLEGSIATCSSLYETAKSMYSRSKLPIRLVDEQVEDFANKKQSSSASALPWLVKIVYAKNDAPQNNDNNTDIISISSPSLTGGHGLNECYKIIAGLPPSCCIIPSSSSLALSTSLYVQIDVSTLSIQQITKICQNYVKYEEAIDSLHSYNRRENKCNQCRSNKLAVGDEGCTNKQRNQRIANCQSLDELVSCMNPKHDVQYKLDLRSTLNSIEFRQHTSSKDKTTVTNWIRFCTAFVLNSARLRSPMALKSTTSIEEEFDLLFEYVVKDRAIRNYYRERRDGIKVKEEEDERLRILMMLD